MKDDKSYVDMGQNEGRDGDKTTGNYWVVLPDGRKQNVKYQIDSKSGYVADVDYNGEAKYQQDYKPAYKEPSYKETSYKEPSYSKPVYQSEPSYEEPKVMYEQPKMTYEQPKKVYEQPKRTYEQPKVVYEQPKMTYEEPKMTYKQPKRTYEQPKMTYEQPKKTYEQPKMTYEQPKESYKPAPEVVYETRPAYQPEVLKVSAPKYSEPSYKSPKQLVYEEPKPVAYQPAPSMEKSSSKGEIADIADYQPAKRVYADVAESYEPMKLTAISNSPVFRDEVAKV